MSWNGYICLCFSIPLLIGVSTLLSLRVKLCLLKLQPLRLIQNSFEIGILLVFRPRSSSELWWCLLTTNCPCKCSTSNRRSVVVIVKVLNVMLSVFLSSFFRNEKSLKKSHLNQYTLLPLSNTFFCPDSVQIQIRY